MSKRSVLGIKMVTYLSVVSLSSSVPGVSVTSNSISPNYYEAPTMIYGQGNDVSLSSTVANLMSESLQFTHQNDLEDYVAKHAKKRVLLQINQITKHKVKVDLEEEYEEI